MRYRVNTPRGAAVAAATVLLAATVWAKFSLGVRFPDIVLEKTEPGAVYNLREMKGLPYVVVNQSDETLSVEVAVEAPPPKQLKEGYEPIANPDWVKVVPNAFRLAPGDIGTADVILSVPSDPAYHGRHYQAHIRSRTKDTGFLGLAVLSELRFSVGTLGPEALRKEKIKQGLLSFDMDMTPQNIRLNDVPLGRRVDVKKTKGISLKITNRGDKPVKLKLASVKVSNQLQQPGYELTPHPEWLTVTPAVLRVKPNRIGEATLSLALPPDPAHAGRRYQFLVIGEIQGLDVPLEVKSFVYVTTEGAPQ